MVYKFKKFKRFRIEESPNGDAQDSKQNQKVKFDETKDKNIRLNFDETKDKKVRSVQFDETKNKNVRSSRRKKKQDRVQER